MSFLAILAFAAHLLPASLPFSVLKPLFLDFAVSAEPLNMKMCHSATRLFVGRPDSSSERVCSCAARQLGVCVKCCKLQ